MKKNAMQAFSDLWRIEADCIYCKFCKRGIVQSRDGESFNHRAGCRNTLSHPWAALKLIINAGIAPAIKNGPVVYLSGPMTGVQELNFPLFNSEAARLRALGYTVVNPAEINLDKDASWEECMRADIAALMACDEILFLPNSEYSRGSRLERDIASSLGMPAKMAHEVVTKACMGTNCSAVNSFSVTMQKLNGKTPAELHSEVVQERDKYLAWLKEIQGALIEHLSAESAGDHVIKSAKLLKTISEISDSMGEIENG